MSFLSNCKKCLKYLIYNKNNVQEKLPYAMLRYENPENWVEKINLLESYCNCFFLLKKRGYYKLTTHFFSIHLYFHLEMRLKIK